MSSQLGVILVCVLTDGRQISRLQDNSEDSPYVQIPLVFPDVEECKEWLARRYNVEWQESDGRWTGTQKDQRWPRNVSAFHINPYYYPGKPDDHWFNVLESI